MAVTGLGRMSRSAWFTRVFTSSPAPGAPPGAQEELGMYFLNDRVSEFTSTRQSPLHGQRNKVREVCELAQSCTASQRQGWASRSGLAICQAQATLRFVEEATGSEHCQPRGRQAAVALGLCLRGPGTGA